MAIDPVLYAKAVRRYSILRPQLIAEIWSPVVGSKTQVFPDVTTFGVESLAYGPRTDIAVVLQSITSDQGWGVQGDQFAITPAPTEVIEIMAVWRKYHQEINGEYPTIPFRDRDAIDTLYEIELLKAHQVENIDAPVMYSIGQTTFDRRGGADSIQRRITYLEAEIQARFTEPLGGWG